MIYWQDAIPHLKQYYYNHRKTPLALPQRQYTCPLHMMSDNLESVSAQIGRSEVLVGAVEMLGSMFRIHFVSKTITNDPRMVSSARTFELEGDSLRYTMEMQTTKVEQPTQHLKVALQREK
jgi:hypothetical protein